MSEKLQAFQNYLLKRLGFESNEFLDLYLTNLSYIVDIYKKLSIISHQEHNELGDRGNFYENFETGYIKKDFRVIDFLVLEYNYKKNFLFTQVSKISNYISATDLANYHYCPIGYSISKSYSIPQNKLAEQGNNFHEQHKLLNFKKQSTSNDDAKSRSYINDKNASFFDNVNNSHIVYNGHDKESPKYFVNDIKKFVGQPDYIFKDAEGKYFVVEEKFKRSTAFIKHAFSKNHKVQLASYIYYINTYHIDYGYLLYWYYDYNYDQPYIEHCIVLKVERTILTERFLESTYNKVEKFINDRMQEVELSEITPKKCANCVYTLLCCHKNKRKSDVSFPYNKNYFRLYEAEYPEILKSP